MSAAARTRGSKAARLAPAAPTAPSAPAAPPAPAAPAARPARQAPTDLTLAFIDEATVRAVSSANGEPDWLLADRLEGLRRFEALPIETNGLYTSYVDLRNAHLAEVRPVERTDRNRTDCGELPEGAAAIVQIDEEGVCSASISDQAAAAGLILEPLSRTGARDPSLFRKLLEGGCALPEKDKLAQMTRALWSAGVLLAVPDGVRLEKPVVLRWTVGQPGTALLARTVISLGSDAEVSIVEEQSSGSFDGSAAQAFYAGTTEAKVGAGSTLSFAGLQDLSLGQVAFQHRSAVLGRGATVRWALAQLGCRVVRSRIDNRLEGDGSTVEQAEIVFGSADQLFDLTSYTRHVGRDTTGNLLSKGALGDRSRAYMKGLATIELSAHGTDSYLGEFGMLLSRQARSVAIPSLEIDQPDCRRAAHSSSVGPIDESQVFYLMSRGLGPEQARKFIVLGYLEPVVARVPLESARDRLRELLEAKWNARTVARPADAAVA
jgi:Fe-S cluster assembly scaffold protein SufB